MLGITQLPMQPYTAVHTLVSTIDKRFTRQASTAGSAGSPQGNQGLKLSPSAIRLATRGVLGRAISANSEALIRTESNQLINLRAKELTQPTRGVQSNVV
ncbi:hypothetical protein D3C76_1351760 [compost metagenome]